MGRGLRAAALATLALACAAPAASATPVPIQGLTGEIDSSWAKGQFFNTLGEDCLSSMGIGWQGAGSRSDPKYTVRYERAVPTAAKGSYDGVAQRGSAYEAAGVTAIQFSRFVGGDIHTERRLDIRELGIEVAGGRAYLTARLVASTAHISAAPRVRIAVINHPKFFSGPSTVPRHPAKTVPDTFLIAVQGKALVTPAFSRAIDRVRCKGKVGVLRPRRVKPGSLFGFVTMQMGPGAAAGTAGSVDLGSLRFSDTEGLDVQTAPVAPAVTGTVKHLRGILLPFGPGAHLPLTCNFGFDCTPAPGAQTTLSGGFTVSCNGRSATVDGLSIAYGQARSAQLDSTLSGSVNGQLMTLVTPGGATQQFEDALSSALGVHIDDATVSIAETFTGTAPL